MSDRPPPDIPPEQRWQWEEAARQAREASERRMIQQQLEGSHYTSPPRTGTPTNWKSERKGLAWILLPFILIVAGAVLFSLVEIDWALLDLLSSVAKGVLIVVGVGFCLPHAEDGHQASQQHHCGRQFSRASAGDVAADRRNP
ncbi:MAG: hypothetical protein M5R40_12950 [Anaerolineae bacterium]|nr:hypothetical protein [Anaerolineae bacterium]